MKPSITRDRVFPFRLSEPEDLSQLEALFKNANLTEANNFTQNVSQSELDRLSLKGRLLGDLANSSQRVVIIKKSFKMENSVKIKVFDQELEIRNRSVSQIKTYSNATLQDIFTDPENLLKDSVDMNRIISDDADNVLHSRSQTSNFVVFVTQIKRDDMLLSLREIIKENLYIFLIQKYPPHPEDFNVLTVREIAQQVGGLSFSVLIGRERNESNRQ